MNLPPHTRAAALVAALATTAAIVNILAEIGHPPPEGQGMISLLQWSTPAERSRVQLAEAPLPTPDAPLPQR